jgi:hypothetical protein
MFSLTSDKTTVCCFAGLIKKKAHGEGIHEFYVHQHTIIPTQTKKLGENNCLDKTNPCSEKQLETSAYQDKTTSAC